MAGSYIEPALVRIAQLDTVGTVADPGVAGVPSGYSGPWGEASTVEDQSGNVSRLLKYKDPIMVLAQVEVNKYSRVQPAIVGVDRSSLIKLAFLFDHLLEKGLVDTETGDALIRAGDKLIAMYDVDGILIQTFRKPELYAVEPQAYGVGIGGMRNLLVVEFSTRDMGQQAA